MLTDLEALDLAHHLASLTLTDTRDGGTLMLNAELSALGLNTDLSEREHDLLQLLGRTIEMLMTSLTAPLGYAAMSDEELRRFLEGYEVVHGLHGMRDVVRRAIEIRQQGG